MSYSKIDAQQFAQQYQVDMKLIDVRSPAEFAGSHIKGAKNVPLDKLDAPSLCEAWAAGDDVYLICQAGGRAAKAAEALSQHTAANLYVIEGGTPQSIAAGCPCNTSDRQVISIERQVRIVAGALVAIGTLLGVLVHPYFLGVPAFVGCGLFFAGVSDTCMMGMLLAKMPWNQ